MLDFLRREKIYIIIFVFILALNMIHRGHVKKESIGEGKTSSSMSLQEIGVTQEKVKAFFETSTPSARFFKYSIFFGFLIFLIALILNIGFIFRRRPKIEFKSALQKESVTWGISDVIRISLVILFISYLVGVIEAFVIKALHINLDANLRIIVITFFIDAFACLVLLYFVIIKHKKTLASVGLKFSFFFKNVLAGITAYIFIVPSLLVILILSIRLLNFLGYSPPTQPILEAFMEEERSRVLLFLTIFVSVFGPLVEEMFFRGFVYPAIKKRLGILAAVLLSAAMFSLLHTNIVGFLPIMTLGVLLAYLYETTGSLVSSITVHIIHNSIIVSFIFFIKELVG